MSGYRYPGKPGAVMDAEYRARIDLTPLVTKCGLCDEWQHTGTAAEGRVQAAQHRASVHPTVKAVRRRRGSLQRWAVSDDSFKAEGDANAAAVAKMLTRRGRAA